MKSTRFIIALLFLLSFALQMYGQKTVVTGKIKDAATGDPIPFANVIFKGTTVGGTTEFDGTFRIESINPTDTIVASYIGYVSQEVPIRIGVSQAFEIQLVEDVMELPEMIVYAGENPAFQILRNVNDYSKKNDKRSLEAYEYESYTKIEIDIDNMSDKFRDRKLVKKITSVMDSIQMIAGENGKPILPVFFSEAISNYFVKNSPFMRHEYMLKTKVTGLGLTDGTLTSQVVGSTFQEYNFYRNYLTILEKEFASPIGGGWKGIYHYDLVDSLYVDEEFCYRIDFFPKRKHDLAFTGTMWITREDWALKQIDASVPKSANLNFVEKLRVQQELERTEVGAWLPSKTRVLVDIAQISDESAGLLAKFYTSNAKYVINEPKEDSFYRIPVEMDAEVRMSDEMYWGDRRHEALSQAEINVFNMVDTLKKIPVVKAYSDIAKMAYSGYYKVGKIDLGPYPLFMSYNDVEGMRFGFGAETNYDFSKHIILRAYGGYGLRDQEWKYSVGTDFILSRKPWTKIGFTYQHEIDPVYFLFEPIVGQVAFYAFTRLGTLRQPFMHDKYEFRLTNQLVRDVNLRLEARHDFFDPLFDFEYYDRPAEDPTSTKSTLRTSQVKIELEWAKDRKYLINDNYRMHAGLGRFPVITARYTLGLKGVFDSDFNYHKVGLTMVKEFKMGQLGSGTVGLDGEYIFGTIPYPLLVNHLGNETPFYTSRAFTLMNNFEFISDHYVSGYYRHHFNGAILNRVPLIKYLKLRLIGEIKGLWGGISQENVDLIVPNYNTDGTLAAELKSLNEEPYVEVGYGFENILKVGQVLFFHRLTHTDDPNARKFGVKLGFNFTL